MINYIQIEQRLEQLGVQCVIDNDQLVVQASDSSQLSNESKQQILDFLKKHKSSFMQKLRLKEKVATYDLSLAVFTTFGGDLTWSIDSAKLEAFLNGIMALRNKAGEDWSHIVADLQRMKAWNQLCKADQAMDEGKVPDGYIKTVYCQHCGDVQLWPECPNEVLGCPWCLRKNRPTFNIH